MSMSETKKRILGLQSNGSLSAFTTAHERSAWGELRKKLQAAGEDFAKGDFLSLRDGQYFNLVCYSYYSGQSPPIRSIGYIMKMLNEIGDPFKIRDWKKEARISSGEGPVPFIEVCARHKVLDQVFAPELWKDKADEMEKLWKLVPRGYLHQIDFRGCHDQVIALSIPELEVTDALTKADLFKKHYGRTALDDPRTWSKWDKIVAKLKKNGELPSKKDLLKTGANGASYIEIAHRNGKLAEVTAMLAKAGDPLTHNDLESEPLKKFGAQLHAYFYSAVTRNDIKLVESLLDLGILDLEYSPSRESDPPFICACQQEDKTLAKALLEAGANPAVTTKIGRNNALHFGANSATASFVISAMKKYYHDNPNALLEALTLRNTDRHTPLQAQDNNYCSRKPETVGLIESAIKKARIAIITADDPKAASDPDILKQQLYYGVQEGNAAFVQRSLDRLGAIFKDKPQEFLTALDHKETGNPKTAYEMAAKHKDDAIRETVSATVAAAAQSLLTLPANKLIEKSDGVSPLDLLADHDMLPELLTYDRWKGDPRGLHQIASRIPRKELDKQLSGQDGRLSYDDLLSLVNASAVKALRMGGRALG